MYRILLTKEKPLKRKGLMQVGMYCKQSPCWMLLRSINLMLPWEEDVEMKRKQGLKNASFHTGMILDNGIQKIKGRNSGIFLTGRNALVSISGFSP